MILETIAESNRKLVEEKKQKVSLEELREKALQLPKLQFKFEKILKSPGMSFICECKKASPSKGVIAEEFPYIQIAKEYEEAGASCISVLTEPKYFLGSDKYVTEISKTVNIPIIRKDFVIDEYMIYEARVIGADAVLLICSLLDITTLKKYINICDSLGLTALVEAHDENEVNMAISAGARVIGVNNRNLRTFEVDFNNSIRLRNLVPDNIVFVAESGVKTNSDIKLLEKAGVNAVLIGETLMRAENKKLELDKLRGI
ncbi:MAG: indole-3-glycerol phosphate synthase TrpC [Eubacterium sp.]